MSLQRSACCRCATSNCCPDLVPSQFFVSIKCTCRWLKSVGGVASRGDRRRRSGFGFIGSTTSNQYSFRTAG
eukprot:761723-Pelagomonas_calceolata.AAC.1